MTYRTKDGDVLDAVVFKQYGATDAYTEAVLNANPGLADLGPVYPAGVLITLPDIGTQMPQLATVTLWS
jgi:phage tail protein X